MSEPSSLLDSVTGLLTPPMRPIDRLMRPIAVFARHKLAGAGLLLVATVIAIIWANSGRHDGYHHLLETPITLAWGERGITDSLHHWINDGLMSVFFFVVGLEIKREVIAGELSSVRKAALPAIAAVGGMIVPALVYFAVNPSGPGQDGWGIPMATDIAFALGVLALLGDRVPLGLKVFLTALAIVDDIGAVLVIAVFYTADISMISLEVGLGCLVLSALMAKMGVRSATAFFLVGLVAWLGFLRSGVHATIAALLMAMTIPARTRIDGPGFIERMRFLGGKLEEVGLPEDTEINTGPQQFIIERMADTLEAASAPLLELEHAIAPIVTFVILPLFAFANAGITIEGGLGELLFDPITLGIVLGLFFGKQLGILVFTWLAVRLGIADLPAGVSWRHVYGVSILGGIGFTMSLFVAGLAFPEPAQLETAKLGILVASGLSGVIGALFLFGATKATRASEVPAA